MPRPLRIQYPGAWYHVMNRGAGRKSIFITDEHRLYFLFLLEEATKMFQIEVHAYCLMSNHYHLLLRTPLGNLSRVMRHINGLYTQQVNRTRKTDGPLFRGRYKSILVEEDSYLLTVSRYIHLNPVEAGLVNKAQKYRWSSYQYYLNDGKKPKWLCLNNILSQFSTRPGLKKIKNYQEFVEMGNPQEVLDFYSVKYTSPFYGSEEFKKKMLGMLDEDKVEVYSPDIRRAKTNTALNHILHCVADYYGVSYRQLLTSQRGLLNWPRLLSIYIARKYFGYSLRAIAEEFQTISYATVSNSLQSVAKRLKIQPTKTRELREIVQIINSKHDT